MTVQWSEASALFYKNNSGPVFRALLAGTLDRAAAEDATAEAFARAFAHWRTVADYPNPRAWVLRVAWNYHTSMWRSWDGRRVADPPPATPPAAEQWVDPDLIAAIAGLPYGQREVLVLAALGSCAPPRSPRCWARRPAPSAASSPAPAPGLPAAGAVHHQPPRPQRAGPPR